MSVPLENIKRPCTPAQSLEKSLKEVKLMKEGKLKKRSWDDLVKELDNEDE